LKYTARRGGLFICTVSLEREIPMTQAEDQKGPEDPTKEARRPKKHPPRRKGVAATRLA